MSNEIQMKREVGAVAAFVADWLAEGRVAFSLDDLLQETGLSRLAATKQIRRLGERVQRVSRPHPFFVVVDPMHRAMGAPPVSWWLDAYFEWLGHPYYLALLSAAESHGASPQAVQVHQVMTDAPRRDVSVGRTQIRFFVKSRTAKTPVLQPAGAFTRLRVSTPEATALDLVTYASRIGGLARAYETLVPMIPLMRSTELTHMLNEEQNRTGAQRLGYLLDQAGATRLASTIHRWLPEYPTWCRLHPDKPDDAAGIRSDRWRVQVNGDVL